MGPLADGGASEWATLYAEIYGPHCMYRPARTHQYRFCYNSFRSCIPRFMTVWPQTTSREVSHSMVTRSLQMEWNTFQYQQPREQFTNFSVLYHTSVGMLRGLHLMPWSGNMLKHPCLEVDARLKGLYHTSVGMLRGLLKLKNHWMVYLPKVLPSPRRTGISPTNGRQSVRMRLMPWSGNLLKHPYLEDFSESFCLEVDASLKGLYLPMPILGRLQRTMLPRNWCKF